MIITTIVRTYARNNMSVADEANNDGYSYDQTNVEIKEIYLEFPDTSALPANTNRYFKLYVGAGEAGRNILVRLNGDSIAGINQLYTKYGSVPTEADHDYAYAKPFSANHQLIMFDAEPGYYYFLVKGFVNGSTANQEIILHASILRMGILDITPHTGSNQGYTTIEAYGSELTNLTTVKLIHTDTLTYHEILADTFISLDNGTRVIARFNLTDQRLGDYHFQCIKEDAWVATVYSGFEVIEGEGPNVQVHWEYNPKSFNPRFNTLIQIKIDIENTGNADAEERFVFVGTPNFNNPVYYSLNDYYNNIAHTQLVLPSEDAKGFPGVLRPGGRRTYYVYGLVGGTQGFYVGFDK